MQLNFDIILVKCIIFTYFFCFKTFRDGECIVMLFLHKDNSETRHWIRVIFSHRVGLPRAMTLPKDDLDPYLGLHNFF